MFPIIPKKLQGKSSDKKRTKPIIRLITGYYNKNRLHYPLSHFSKFYSIQFYASFIINALVVAGEPLKSMKKLSLLLVLAIACLMTDCIQAAPAPQEQNTVQRQAIMPYKLYPTSNMWTFIKLDTRNGKMWQVQFSVKGDDYRFEYLLNATPLIWNFLTVWKEKLGRFNGQPNPKIRL